MFAAPVARTEVKIAPKPTDTAAHRLPAGVHRRGRGQTDQALLLQRAIGNQATLRLLAPRASHPTEARSNERHQGGRDPGAEQSAPSSPAARPPLGLLQPKLTIGQIDDPLEHEADRVADQVMRMPAPLSLPRPGETEVLRRKMRSLHRGGAARTRRDRIGRLVERDGSAGDRARSIGLAGPVTGCSGARLLWAAVWERVLASSRARRRPRG
jgi:hypothetical protein